jgi:putative SOS response-associated peptidase YedK
MCGRFAITLPVEAMAQLFAAAPANDLPEVPNYNVCPTTQIHTIMATDNGRQLRAMRWGFIPNWYTKPNDGPLLINARAETIATKPAFAKACRERRCLIPVSGFYEWTKTPEGARLPWYITPRHEEAALFAGIWQDWEHDGERLKTAAIVTVAANKTMSKIHKRMPVSLAPDQWASWLGEQGKGAARLMQPAPEDRFAAWRVSPEVNSNRASGEQLIRSLEADNSGY